MEELKKNEIYTAFIDGYSSDGSGVCHIGRRAVFVPRTVMGEEIELKILKASPSQCYAKAIRLISPSPERIDPVCPFFGQCGGCDTMHMSYAEELRFKMLKVNDALERIGRQERMVRRIIASDNILNYRNKAVFNVAGSERGPVFGFYRERSHLLVDISGCAIQNELSNKAASALLSFMSANSISPYNEQTGKGSVRHIFCRKAAKTDDAVLCIIAARGFGALTGQLVESLRGACPGLSGIVLNINKTRGNSVLAGDYYTLWGKPDITDILCGYKFDIAPQAFFQVNPGQAEKLYKQALEYAVSGKTELAFDLYCGAGTISLCLAGKFDRVIGAEISPQAVTNAVYNAKENKVSNVEFICADAAMAAKLLSQRALKPDVILVDPPRKGMDAAAVSAVSLMSPERIVYVSCDPATLARDILLFNAYGYSLSSVTAVDMFPRTAHVETVVLITRVDK